MTPKYSNGFLDDLVCQIVDTAQETGMLDEYDADVYDAVRVRLHKAGVEVLSAVGERLYAGSNLVE